MEIYIRPLKREDALTSYKWRNDPDIWKFTGSKPDRKITDDIELDWIRKVMKEENSKRFAICLKRNDKYLGNVQLTNIKDGVAEFHIFIGEKKYWGKGIATEATKQILGIAKYKLNLNEVYLFVKSENIAAVKAYQKIGFKKTGKPEEMRVYL